MAIAFTHEVSPNIAKGEVTFIERNPINYELALQQHNAYCQAIENCGVCVQRLAVNLAFPDSCFIEDNAIVVDEVAIVTSMGSSSRQDEPKAIAPELAKYKEIVRLELPAKIEGGDVLRIGKKLYVGISGRTNIKGANELAGILKPWNYEVTPVKFKDCLHLKTACTAIDEQTLLINPQWIVPETFSEYKLLFVPEDECWAANTLRVKDTIFLQDRFPKTHELVKKHHESIKILDISEFQKVEAGLSCLSIIFDM
jgi:dimethylargininase